MTYKKAEIRVLGHAVAVIQSLEKVPVLGFDNVDLQSKFATNGAYDLDE